MSEQLSTETRPRHLHIPEAEELPGQLQSEPESWANQQEIDTFDLFVRRFWRGEITPEELSLIHI